MITQTTIKIHAGVKAAAKSLASTLSVRGGLSGYIEMLIKDNLKKNGVDYKSFSVEPEEQPASANPQNQ